MSVQYRWGKCLAHPFLSLKTRVAPPESMYTFSLARNTPYLQNVSQINGQCWVGGTVEAVES